MSDIMKLVGVGLLGGMLSLTVKKDKPEFALMIALMTAVIISIEVISGIGNVISEIEQMVEISGINIAYLNVCIKAMGTAYVSQFASEILRDGGEGAIAGKVEMAGKITILILTLPVLSSFLKMCIEAVSGL